MGICIDSKACYSSAKKNEIKNKKNVKVFGDPVWNGYKIRNCFSTDRVLKR